MTHDTKSVLVEVTKEPVIETVQTKSELPTRRRKKDLQRRGPLSGIPKIPGFATQLILIAEDNGGRYEECCVHDDWIAVQCSEIGRIKEDGTPETGNAYYGNKGHGKLLLVKKPQEFFDEDQLEEYKKSVEMLRECKRPDTAVPLIGRGSGFNR